MCDFMDLMAPDSKLLFKNERGRDTGKDMLGAINEVLKDQLRDAIQER